MTNYELAQSLERAEAELKELEENLEYLEHEMQRDLKEHTELTQRIYEIEQMLDARTELPMSDPDSFDADDFIEAPISMRKTLDEANVPKEGRFIQVQYETIEYLFGKEFADNLWRDFE